ncbi:MAG TPA: LEA type 2 family protein [Spirochaetia bacterium]|nr:LEA type 2 family protein [Spirochaetia bacterium]
MARKVRWVFVVPVVALVVAGCASQGPSVPVPPRVRVSELRSLSFSPDVVKFRAKVTIRNISGVQMSFEKTDYAVDMFDSELFSDSFSDMLRTNGGDTQTVTFPFQISMADIMKKGVDVLAEEGLRVTFRGQVFCAPAYGFEPIPFEASLTIPLPKIPAVTFLGTAGAPFTSTFRIRLGVTNPNDFPFTVDSIDSYLVLNDTRYSLLRTNAATEIPAGGSGIIVLQMKTTPAKALSFALNLAQSGEAGPVLDLTGSVTLSTPYGWVYVPVKLKQALSN